MITVPAKPSRKCNVICWTASLSLLRRPNRNFRWSRNTSVTRFRGPSSHLTGNNPFTSACQLFGGYRFLRRECHKISSMSELGPTQTGRFRP